jgi:hypothetical protein
MASKIFKLTPDAPARADFFKRGVLQLNDISDELALELAKEGCPYIELTPEGKELLKPAAKPIEVKQTPKPQANTESDKEEEKKPAESTKKSDTKKKSGSDKS